MSNFSNALNDLANQPNSASFSEQAVDAGTQLASSINSLRSAIDVQRQQANLNVVQLTTQANSLIKQIAQLNPQITEMEAGSGSQAGSLRDQRYQDLNQLSQILPITYTQNSDGSINVFTGSNYLVQGINSSSYRRWTARATAWESRTSSYRSRGRRSRPILPGPGS